MLARVVYLALAVVFFVGTFSGCSPDMFDQKKTDAQIVKQKPYRLPQPGCSSLQFQSSTLTEKNFRDLIDCFNSNGSIQELSAFVQEASSEQLRPLVNWLNVGFLDEKTRLYQSRQTLVGLKGSGRLDLYVSQLGKIFRDPTAFKKLLTEVQAAKNISLPVDLIQNAKNEDFLRSIRLIKKIADAPSFHALQKKWAQNAWTDAQKNKLNADFQKLLALPHGRELLVTLAKDQSPYLFNAAFKNFSQTRLLIDLVLENEAKVWRDLTNLSKVFDSPISCLGGEKNFPYPWANLERELQAHSATDRTLYEFSTRFTISTVVGIAKNFCAIPPEFYRTYPTYLKVTASNAGETFISVLRGAIQSDLVSAFKNWAAGSDRTISDVLKDFDERDLLSDFLLVIGTLNESDRAFITQTILASGGYFSPQKIEVYSLLENLLAVNPADLEQFMSALEGFYAANSSHPWIEGVRAALLGVAHGDNDLLLLADLVKLKGFDRASKLIFEMSQDGRLSSMMVGAFDLMSHHAELGKVPMDVSPMVLPLDPPLHRLQASDFERLTLEVPASNLAPSMRACLAIDLKKRISDQEAVYFSCLENPQDEPEGREATRDMTRLMATLRLPDGRTFGELLEDWGNHPPKGMIEKIKVTISTGGITQLTKMLSPFFSGTELSHQWLGELGEWFGSMRSGAPTAFQGVLRGFGKLLQDPRIPKMVRLGLNPVKPARVFDEVRISRWVKNKECLTDPAAVLARTQVIQNDYESALSGWERVEGEQRKKWDSGELKQRLMPVFEKLTHPELTGALSNLISRFSKNPQNVIRWFSQRSEDYRLLSTFYPGEEYPNVRLVSSLDRFEILLKSADFQFVFPENYAKKFMGQIAQSWGDEPRENWPDSIRKLYVLGGKPPTLRETFNDIKKTLVRYEHLGALPKLRGCDQVANPLDDLATQKKETQDPKTWISAPDFVVPQWVKGNVFNLHQTLSVIEENLPDSGTPMAGGMRILRDIFFEVSNGADGFDLILRMNDVSFLRTLSLYFSDHRDPEWLKFQGDILGQEKWLKSTLSLFTLTLDDAEIRNHFSRMWDALSQLIEASNFQQDLSVLSHWNEPEFYQWLSRRLEAGSSTEASDVEMLLRVLEEKPESFRRILYGACQGVKSNGVEEFLQILERHL